MPRMSTTELSMKMSLSPTNCRTMPEASVLTITFGTPSGSARIAAVRDGRAGRAAQAEDAGHLAPRVAPRARAAPRLRRPASPPRRGRPSSAPPRASSRPARRCARGGCRRRRPGVPSAPTSTRVTATPHDVEETADEIGLAALGVERGEEEDGGHRRGSLYPITTDAEPV